MCEFSEVKNPRNENFDVGRFLINLVLQGSLLDLSSTSSLVKSTEEGRQEK